MRAVFLRRMMVLGVCGLGVAALYLVPGLAQPSRVGLPTPASVVPVSRTAPTPDSASIAARAPLEAAEGVDPVQQSAVPEPSDPAIDVVSSTAPPSESDPDSASVTTSGTRPSPRSGSTPFAPRGGDATPPEPVTELAVRATDPDQVRVAWAPSADDAGTVSYRIWLNGYEVQQTSATEATLDWFNDDSAQQVVVVRAVDHAGNQSRTAATLLLRRPEPDATPAPVTSAPPDVRSDVDPGASSPSPAAPSASTPETSDSPPPTTASPTPTGGADRTR